MKKKILFLIESFAGGGVEKVFIDLINNMDISKYDITVMSIWDYGVRKKDLRKDVKYKSIFPNIRGISRVFHNFVEKSDGSLLYKLGIREKYDIEIAFIEGRATKIIVLIVEKLLGFILIYLKDIGQVEFLERA